MAGKITTEARHDGQVVRFTLNAPKGNVLDAEMMADLQAELDGLSQWSHVKLIEFTGAGNHFSFGASVPEHVKEKAPMMLKQFHGLFYSLINISIPSVALVSGQCLGGGMELALGCNFIMADKTAYFGQPEISLGVFAPPASLILPMRVGQAKADELLLAGRIIKAQEAAECGLVGHLFEDRTEMLEHHAGWVEKNILPKSASSLKFAVRAARWQFNQQLRSGLAELEQFYCDELMKTKDANEGINSFMEKRKPDWTNS